MGGEGPKVARRGVAPAIAGVVDSLNRAEARMLAMSGPPVLALRNRGLFRTSLVMPVRRLGDLPSPGPDDNYVWDARRALKRLRSLWAITEPEYQAAEASWGTMQPNAHLSGADLAALIKAIRKAQHPSLANEVSTSFLPVSSSALPPGQSVGAGCTNDPVQVKVVQGALSALGFLDGKMVGSEAPPNMPNTLQAIVDFKMAIASATLGWPPIRADEDRDGGDKFGGRTYAQDGAKLTLFIPEKAPQDKNFVHIFCAPGDVSGNGGENNLLMQGVRAAFDQTKWLVVGVVGVPHGKVTVSTTEISALLKRANRATTAIDGIRISAHSRGHITVSKSLNGKDGSGTRLIDPSIVDLVTIFDASYASLGDGLRQAGLDSKARLYDAIVANASGIKGTQLVHREGIRAIAFVRFMQDWMAMTAGAFQPPADKLALANLLLAGNPPLPRRGDFTTRGAPGKVDFNGFCQAHASDIAAITDPKTGLGDYVRSANMPQYFDSWRPDLDIEVHHYFVTELIHEVVGP